ncbi:MAG: class I SAM-dependent methyltransferase [Euryarchaeota archaeon]|nr:class I SAM-dependent methyltransferase [Euryarchaeota archaeon]
MQPTEGLQGDWRRRHDPKALRDAVTEFLIVSGALRSGLIDQVAERPYDVRALARVAGLDRRVTERVVRALVAYGVLMHTPMGLALTKAGKEAYHEVHGRQRHTTLAATRTMRALFDLPKVLESGAPLGLGDDPAGLRDWIYAQAERDPKAMDAAAEAFMEGLPEGAKVFDLGGGPGHMARRFLDRGAVVTLADLPQVIELVRSGLEATQGLRLVATDVTAGLPEGTYDAVYMGNLNILLPAEENLKLFGRVKDHVAEGGRVAVQTALRDRSPDAVWLAVMNALYVEAGDSWPLERYAEWAEAAGLGAPEVLDLDEAKRQQLLLFQA